MDSNAGLVESLFEKGVDYSKTTIDLVRLKAVDKSAEVLSSATAGLAVVVVLALAGLIVNIGIALWIGERLGRSYYGFFVTAGFYFIIAILLYIFRRQWIKTPVSNSLITQLLN